LVKPPLPRTIPTLANKRKPTGRGLKLLATTFVDDVVVSGLGSGAATDFNIFDFARIEVLRGTQPTHFGEGSVGGAIRF